MLSQERLSQQVFPVDISAVCCFTGFACRLRLKRFLALQTSELCMNDTNSNKSCVCLSHTVQWQFPHHLKMPFSPPSLALCEYALLILAATGCHCCAHTPTHNTSCALSIDNGVPVWMDRQMCALEGHLPGQGPNPSQHWVHHRDGEVLPLPGAEGILLHHLGHGQPLEQPVGQPENQRAHQYWRAWVTLEHRKQGLHPLLPTPLSLGACS